MLAGTRTLLGLHCIPPAVPMTPPASVPTLHSQVADLQRQLSVAQQAAAEAAGNDAKLKRQAQTVAELAAAKSKLVTTESRLAKLQDRHAALQKQYQEAQRTAAEWEAAGVRRQVRAGLHCGMTFRLRLCMPQRIACPPEPDQPDAGPAPVQSNTSTLPWQLQEETEAELEETRERLAAAEALVSGLGCSCQRHTLWQPLLYLQPCTACLPARVPVQQERLPCSCLPHPSAHTCSAPHFCHPLISPTAERRDR